jgi:ribosomal protein L37AE/L43A
VNYGTAKERRAKKIRGVKHTAEHNKKISESMKRHFAEKNCPNCGADMRERKDNG